MTTTPSRLLTLPLEIRTLIYTHLFGSQTIFIVHPRDLELLAANREKKSNDNASSSPSKQQPPIAKTLSIFLVCRLCHAEAQPIFYATAGFTFRSCNYNAHDTDDPRTRIPGSTKGAYYKFNIRDQLRALFGPPVLPTTRALSSSGGGGNNTLYRITRLVYPVQCRGTFYEPTSFDKFGPVTWSTDVNFLELLPSLKVLEVELKPDFHPLDQMDFDKAVRHHLLRYDGDRIVERTINTFNCCYTVVKDMLWKLKRTMDRRSRGYRVVVKWKLDYRFLKIVGEIDLDEWVLRFWDGERKGGRVYEVKQAEPVYSGGDEVPVQEVEPILGVS